MDITAKNDNIKIRLFTFSDLPAIIELIKSSQYSMPYAFYSMTTAEILHVLSMRLKYEKYVDRFKRFAVKRSVRFLLTSEYDRVILVAEDANKQILGAALLSNTFEDVWSLDIIVVNPNLRLRGVGSKILGGVISYVKNRKGSELTVSATTDNEDALRLYSKFSFEENFRITELKLNVRNQK